MALSAGSIISASDFNSLKDRVNSEMSRRKYTGSLSGYQTTQSATKGNQMTATQANAVINAVRAINTSGMSAAVGSGTKAAANSLSTASTKLTDYASRALVGTSSGCASSCSGLCQGCNNTCTGSCTGSCSGGCSGSCTSCSGCTGCSSCTGGCDGCDGCSGCGSGCAGGCWGCGGQCSGSSCGWKGL